MEGCKNARIEQPCSATGFIKRFKYETGLTPADFFQRIKVEEARRRLAVPKAAITAIAFDLGFSSSQYFASVFKKYTGTTPREYSRKVLSALSPSSLNAKFGHITTRRDKSG